jgi:hypothetical protein
MIKNTAIAAIIVSFCLSAITHRPFPRPHSNNHFHKEQWPGSHKRLAKEGAVHIAFSMAAGEFPRVAGVLARPTASQSRAK